MSFREEVIATADRDGLLHLARLRNIPESGTDDELRAALLGSFKTGSMSEMIERVARALLRSKRNAGSESYSPGWIDRHIDEHWPLMAEDARVAIEAMKVPTEKMLKAGVHPPLAQVRPYQHQEILWQAMIEEALK